MLQIALYSTSSGGVTTPSLLLLECVCDSFAMLDHIFDVIYQSQIQHHKAAKLVLGSREVYQLFFCSNQIINHNYYLILKRSHN